MRVGKIAFMALFIICIWGCRTGSDSVPDDPYAGLTCSEKSEKMAEAINEFNNKYEFSLRKRSFGDSLPIEQATPDSARSFLVWVPPYGFPSHNVPIDSSRTEVVDTSKLVEWPSDYSVVSVNASMPYYAHTEIHDAKGVIVAEFDDNFGFHGETVNSARSSGSSWIAFLFWNNLDLKGQRIKDGLYTWEMEFRFSSNKIVSGKRMTGYLGEACSN